MKAFVVCAVFLKKEKKRKGKKTDCFPFHPASFPLNFLVSQVCLPELNFRYSIMAAAVLRGKCKNAFQAHSCFSLFPPRIDLESRICSLDRSTDFSPLLPPFSISFLLRAAKEIIIAWRGRMIFFLLFNRGGWFVRTFLKRWLEYSDIDIFI